MAQILGKSDDVAKVCATLVDTLETCDEKSSSIRIVHQILSMSGIQTLLFQMVQALLKE